MRQAMFEIRANHALTTTVWELQLVGDTGAISAPGQFVEAALPGRFLRRPFSVCDWASGHLTLVYKTVGAGTRELSQMHPGEQLDLLTGLGNGYNLSQLGDRPLLVGGGVGVPPMYGLCKRLIAQNKCVSVILGFNTQDDIFYVDQFKALGARVTVVTVDGSAGIQGFVTDALDGLAFDHICACGPLPMLQALTQAVDVPGHFSLEERMGCGFGACMGCTIQTSEGTRQVCKDGPVFRREVILWEK